MLATLLTFSLGSLACAAGLSYNVLFWLRFLQGIGLGGEIPLMAAYVNEFAHARDRGRFSISVQVLFSVGLLAVAIVSRLCRAALGLAMDVHHRCCSGTAGHPAANPVAGIATLARQSGPLR